MVVGRGSFELTNENVIDLFSDLSVIGDAGSKGNTVICCEEVGAEVAWFNADTTET